FCNLAVGETAATEGGMRRGQVSPAAKWHRKTKTGGTGSKKLPDPSIKLYSVFQMSQNTIQSKITSSASALVEGRIER
ncbi:MAG: hypothetical protein JSU83_20380, partial [Deltaproteobacteria bacterium]